MVLVLSEGHSAGPRAAEWEAGGDRGLELDRSSSWDGAAAEEAVFSWAGWPGSPDPARARRAFLVHDSANPDLRGSYKLPFATARGGKLVAVASALRDAASRLPQTEGLPAEARSGARSTIEAYERRGLKEAAAGLAEFAQSSHLEFRLEELLEAVAEEAAYVSEAGGFRSWLRSLDGGVDPRLPGEIDAAAARGYPSEGAREEALGKISGWKARAERHRASLERGEAAWSDKEGRYRRAEADTRAEVLRQIRAGLKTVGDYLLGLERAEENVRKAKVHAG